MKRQTRRTARKTPSVSGSTKNRGPKAPATRLARKRDNAKSRPMNRVHPTHSTVTIYEGPVASFRPSRLYWWLFGTLPAAVSAIFLLFIVAKSRQEPPALQTPPPVATSSAFEESEEPFDADELRASAPRRSAQITAKAEDSQAIYEEAATKIQSTLSGTQEKLDKLYDDLRRLTSVSIARMEVDLKIEPDGNVVGAWIEESSLGRAHMPFQVAVRRTLMLAKYPSTGLNGTVQVAVPLRFSPSGSELGTVRTDTIESRDKRLIALFESPFSGVDLLPNWQLPLTE